ncbi:MAG: hypothetical protein ACLFV7_04625 [Phycisphaerae bacterium]
MTETSATTRRAGLRGIRWSAALWSGWLAGCIIVAGTHLRGTPAGSAVLTMIACGFLLFYAARTGGAPASMEACCWRSLSRPLRVVYAGGYALMVAGTLVSTAASVARLVS